GGPIAKVRDGDVIEIEIDRKKLIGKVNLISDHSGNQQANQILTQRPPHPDLRVDPSMPDDTRLWAALQQAGGGTWGGCVYDVDSIIERLLKAVDGD
ncbi:MAG: YjhG/YagF family D-xylonate dehydratase, partial [Rubripirellula sp.]